jgi:predicted DNA-binding antitoxin AbrB/MazE fold protein
MVHNIDAIYDQGVFRPIQPLSLPAGTRVHLRIEEENGARKTTSSDSILYRAWLEELSGRWVGDFVRGDEGDFESREKLS